MKHNPTLFAEGFLFPEAPRWHADRKQFFVSDIDRGQVFAISPDGQRQKVYQGPDWVSGTAFADDNTLLVTNARSRSLVRVNLDRPDAPAEMIASLAQIAPYGINDMVCTPGGVCFIDTVSFDFVAYARGEIAAQPSVLARVDRDGSVSTATAEVNFPNGMVITPDGKRLLVADSIDQCVYGFSLAADGTLSARTCFAALPGETKIYCGHEYTLSNGKFAVTVDPDNPALRARMAQVAALRAADRFTLPTTIAEERATNPFLRAGESAVKQAMGLSGADADAVFAEMRARKNRFAA